MAKTLTTAQLLEHYEALQLPEQVQLFNAIKKILAEKKKLKGEELNLLQTIEE